MKFARESKRVRQTEQIFFVLHLLADAGANSLPGQETGGALNNT
jgi:hypothetical protein